MRSAELSEAAWARIEPLMPQVAEAFTLGSALIAHLAVGHGPEAWGFAAGTGVLWGLSYFFWRRLEAMAASA
jgi:hypothetical protein